MFVILIVITLVSIGILFVAAVSYFRSDEVATANARLAIYQRSLNDTLQRFQHLPYMLARDSLVISVAEGLNSTVLLNNRLEEFARESSLEAIYLMDINGLVLASSNHGAQQSFVGKNYGFRPYFLTSSNGQRGEFFGVGATTGRPGYFVSEPVLDNEGEFIGVIAIKLDMSELQAVWEASLENVFVSNAVDVIVLSSNNSWLYKLLNPLSSQQINEIKKGRQFGNYELAQLEWQHDGSNTAILDGEQYVYVFENAERLGWTVHYLLTEDRIYERVLLTTGIFGGGVIFLVLISTFLRSIRISEALAVSQNDRMKLLAINNELELAQNELRKTSKLAALGQLAASVTHELGQPISALRNYLAAIELDGSLKDIQMQSRLAKVTDRMEKITRQLRFFVRSDKEHFEKVDLSIVVKNAVELVTNSIQNSDAKIKLEFQAGDFLVFGHQLRLEQVVVNLISNAISAIEDNEYGLVQISLCERDGRLELKFEDNGSGLGGRSLETLLEPFHTTKASGEGMGLGLSIAAEIVRQHDGEIDVEPALPTGSRFLVILPTLRASDK